MIGKPKLPDSTGSCACPGHPRAYRGPRLRKRHRVAETIRICSDCGLASHGNTQSGPNCGSSLATVRRNPPDKRLPDALIWGIVLASAAPMVAVATGLDLGLPSGPTPGGLPPGPELVESVYAALAGAFLHTLLECASIALTVFTVSLAFTVYRRSGDVVAPLMGVALACAGAMHGFALARLGLAYGRGLGPRAIHTVHLGRFAPGLRAGPHAWCGSPHDAAHGVEGARFPWSPLPARRSPVATLPATWRSWACPSWSPQTPTPT
jgi:hypothetical protein